MRIILITFGTDFIVLYFTVIMQGKTTRRPTKSSKNNFFAAHAIVNRQHDDVQNERSLGTNLSQLIMNENENG